MDVLRFLVVLVAITLTNSRSLADSNEHKSRVVDRPLSDEEHFADNFEDDEHHNVEYDHEAFLGKDEEKTFDQLSPEESKERLGIIYDKIDKDQNGEISEEELTSWIRHVQMRYIHSDSDRQWSDHIPEGDGNTLLKWETYMERTYGHNIDEVEKDDTEGEEMERYDYRHMMKRDKRRWAKADENGDGLLTKAEFTSFLHPEEVDHMKDVVIEETLEDIDKNKDGVISLEEYIGDMWTGKDTAEEEPDWIKEERNQFTSYRDKNNDGVMDREEVKDWVIPDDYDHAESEAKHLIHEADKNQDGTLSKAEMLDKYDLFVGSQATDFGEALTKHDEF